MYIQIAVLIFLTIAAAGLILAPRHVASRVIFSRHGDLPRPFGPDMSWLAVRSTDTQAVLRALEITDPEPANWSSGVGAIYDAELGGRIIFLSPPVQGWTLLAGVPLPLPPGKAFADNLTPLLGRLSSVFPDVQFFAAYSSADIFGWARVENGQITRAFAASEEGIVLNRGRLTREEKSLGLKLFEVRGIRGRKGDAGGPIVLHPTDEQVFQLAAAWSLDPSGLGALQSVEPGTGFIADAPKTWRARLVQRAA